MEITNVESNNLTSAVDALGALAQEHRLSAFRLLVQAGDRGMAAGAIAKRLDIAPSSLSFHLSGLSRAGLVTEERQSRSIIYRANFARMTSLLTFLTENCCRGAQIMPEGNLS